MTQISNISIRAGKYEDIPYVFSWVQSLALFEKAPEAVVTSEEELRRDLFESGNGPQLIIAEHNNQPVGMALFYEAYSTWKGKMMFLDDLFVEESHRGLGIGRELMQHLFQICKERGYRQMRWQVLHWNTRAIEFYEELGATVDTEWYTCKMNF